MTNQNEPTERARQVEPPMSQVNVNASGTASGSSGPLFYARRVVALLFGILIVVIAVRFLLLALGGQQRQWTGRLHLSASASRS